MTAAYDLTVRSENPIPPDVLIEHIAVALQQFNYTGKVQITMNNVTYYDEATAEITPFSNPSNVVFDDVVKSEPYTGPLPAGGITDVDVQRADIGPEMTIHPFPADPYPLTSRAVDFLRNLRRHD